MTHSTTLHLPDIVNALLSIPITSLVIAVFAALVVEAWASHSSRGRDGEHSSPQANSRLEIRRRYRSEVVLLGAVAVVVMATPLVDVVLRSYVIDMSASNAPLRVAMPLLTATLGIALVATAIATHGTKASDVPVLPAARRTWPSFSRRRDFLALATILLGLVATTVFAGLASSTDRDGQHTRLEIPVPNLPDVDPLQVQFYGWTYGTPALLGSAALLCALAAFLRLNAVRPFIRPETANAERMVRRHLASDAAQVGIAAVALALAAAWRLVAEAGAITTLVIMGENDEHPYDATWRYGEIAAFAGWGAPILEIVGFTLLVLVAIRVPRTLPVGALTAAGAARAEELR